MPPRLLILAGTTEATELARLVAEAGLDATVSFAGRVARPRHQPLPQRIGGFGGVAGLKAYLAAERITHLIDATHPFAAQMSANAVEAAAQAGINHAMLTRAPWAPVAGDRWLRVPDIPAAVAALDRPTMCVMLAVGRTHLAEFAPNPQHRYLLRLVDPPEQPLPLPDTKTIVDRGPFDAAADTALMRAEGIEIVVSKNAGGIGAYAKIEAARALHLPVIMIDRPELPETRRFTDVREVLDWIGHASAHLGV